MTPNEKKLKEAKQKLAKVRASDNELSKAANKLYNEERRLEEDVVDIRQDITWDKQEAKLLVKLKTGQKGVFDTRYSLYQSLPRHPYTYWRANRSAVAYGARAGTKGIKVFDAPNLIMNMQNAKYFAIHGKLKPVPKKKKTSVDIGALNRALSNTGYKVVAK